MPLVRRFAVVLMCGAGGAWASAQPPGDGPVFTAEQAAAGKTALPGALRQLPRGRPPRARTMRRPSRAMRFVATWQAKPVKELFDFVRTTMPPEGGSISADDYLAIVAYALQENGATAGTQPLTPSTSTLISAVLSRPKPQPARD